MRVILFSILVIILDKFVAVLVNCIIGEMHKVVLHVLIGRRCVLLSSQPDQTLLVDEYS